MTCSDGLDNDGDGLTDLGDTGCQLPAHDIELKVQPGLKGPKAVTPCSNGEKQYLLQVRNNESSAETIEMAVLIDPLTAFGGAHVIDIFGSDPAGSAVTSIDLGQGGQTNSDTGGAPGPSLPIGTDGRTVAGAALMDLEPEGLGLATISMVANDTLAVHIRVSYDPPADCAGAVDSSSSDYNMTVDVCHSGDPNPLGLFGTGACTGSPVRGHPVANDGGQDRVNTGNDSSISKLINDKNR